MSSRRRCRLVWQHSLRITHRCFLCTSGQVAATACLAIPCATRTGPHLPPCPGAKRVDPSGQLHPAHSTQASDSCPTRRLPSEHCYRTYRNRNFRGLRRVRKPKDRLPSRQSRCENRPTRTPVFPNLLISALCVKRGRPCRLPCRQLHPAPVRIRVSVFRAGKRPPAAPRASTARLPVAGRSGSTDPLHLN